MLEDSEAEACAVYSFLELGFSKDSKVASFHPHDRPFWPRQVKVQTAFTRSLVGMVNMETGLGNQAPVKGIFFFLDLL